MSGKVKSLLLAAYALPYPFLAMWEDAAFGSLWFYGVMIIALILLGRYSIRNGYHGTMFAGNGLSLLLSLLCSLPFLDTVRWSYYFKPFSALQMLFFLFAIILLIELTVLWVKKKRESL